jgi:Glycosyltransferase like family 2
MISYCIACYRPRYTSALIDELIRKTSVEFEILLWINVEDEEFEAFLKEKEASGAPLRVIGRTPENIGMAAYFHLFAHSRFGMVVQIDDDVVCVSPRIAETAHEIFSRFSQVGMLTADVWQDDYTNGARPPMEHYRVFNVEYGLYDGPIDGWFAVYRKESLHVCRYIQPRRYLCLGLTIKKLLRRSGSFGLLCTRMKVFHVIGPEYASYYGMLDFEIEKYKSLGRVDIVKWYSDARDKLPPQAVLHQHVKQIQTSMS